MEIMRAMNQVKNISPRQFIVFRIVFGVYLAWHFAALVPYSAELFSNAGVIPEARFNLTHRAFPNLLAIADAPWQVTTLMIFLTGAAVSFAVGRQRRTCALILWYGWACLFNRNNLISNPGIPYVGLLLILCVIVPAGEVRDPEWKMPAFIFWGAWFLLAAGYTYSGVWKLISPSWQDGSALQHLLTNPLARPGFARNFLLAMPWPLLVGLSWIALAGELLFLPLSIFKRGRFIAWVWMLAMHLGILTVVDFADLTGGMLMIHLFTFDPDWIQSRFSNNTARRQMASGSDSARTSVAVLGSLS